MLKKFMEDCKDNNYRLSVIIPHYQSFDLLQTCLDSIPASRNIQVIVCDDKSTDWEQEQKALKSAYPHVLFFSMSHNRGAGAARNAGLRMAKGEWLMFADADDFFTPGAFDIIRSCYYSDADIIYFKADSIDLLTGERSGRHLHINNFIDAYTSKNKISEGNLRFRCYAPYCKMIRRSVVVNYDIWFDEVKYSNDVMFSVKVGYYVSKIEVVKQTIYCITASSNSLTRSIKSDAIMCRYNVAIRYQKFLENIGAKKFRIIILRYFCMALKHDKSCLLPMIKIGIKNRINLFAGLHRWYQIFDRNKRQMSHF